MTLSSFFLFLLLPLLLQLDKFLLHVPQVVRRHLSPLQQPLCLLLPSLLLLLLLLRNESRRAGNHCLDPVVGCQPHAAPPAPSLAPLLAASLPLLLLLLLWLLLLFLLLASELCGKVAGGDVLVHAGAEVALPGLLPVGHHPLLHLTLVVDAVPRDDHLLWLRPCLLFSQLHHSLPTPCSTSAAPTNVSVCSLSATGGQPWPPAHTLAAGQQPTHSEVRHTAHCAL